MTSTLPPSRARKLGILAICCSSLFIVGIDVTGVNVALPSIGRGLHAGISGLQWITDAYTLVLASLLMLGGSIADRLGRRRIFITGLSAFALGSLLCSVATTSGELIAFRALQAVGGAMLNPVAMSIITNTFTEPRERAQAVGVWGVAFGLSLALGPVVGGGLVSAISWRAIFLVNVPVAIAAIALTVAYVPESRAPKPRRFDPVAQVLMITLLAAVTYAIIEAPDHGWGAASTLAVFAVAAISAVSLVFYERRRTEPLIDPRFFASVPFSASIVACIAAFAVFGGFLFLNTLYLQESRGLSPISAGLTTLPVAVMIVLISPISGRIVGRFGPRLPLLLGGLGLAAGSGVLVTVTANSSLLPLIGGYLLTGIGFGFVNAPITTAAVSGMPRAQAGVAAAIASTSRQFGSTLGVAVTGAIVASDTGTGHATALALASHPAWWMLAGTGALVIVLGLIATSTAARASGERTARLLNPEALSA